MSNFEGHDSVTGSHLLDAVWAAQVAQSIMEDAARSTPQFAGYDENGEPIWLTPPPVVHPAKQYAHSFKDRNTAWLGIAAGLVLMLLNAPAVGALTILVSIFVLAYMHRAAA